MCSETGIRPTPGSLTTAIPAALAASRSIESVPRPDVLTTTTFSLDLIAVAYNLLGYQTKTALASLIADMIRVSVAPSKIIRSVN
ncbi:MAG: hypothetical protein VX941_09415 [Pseudomonadota bacterium]|nr:hypothetical protein [Pseudomonadota bacterium]